MMADLAQDSTGHVTPCNQREPYALQVLGEQMEPEFPDGCIVIVAPADTCRDGDYCFVEVEGVRWFRRYVNDSHGPERLVAEHPRYPDIDLAGRRWTLIGVIVQRNIRRRIKHYGQADKASAPPVASPTGSN
jgi:SOS-response transcriptional repressor LexA